MLDVKMMRQNFDEVKAKLQTRGVKEEIGTMCLLKLLN